MKSYSFCFLLRYLLLWVSRFYKIQKNRRKGVVVTDFIFTISALLFEQGLERRG